MLLKRYNGRRSVALPVVYASTPSYKDGHVEGFHSMVHRIVEAVAIESGPTERTMNVLPPMVSPADLRHLRELIQAFGVAVTMVPDYSDTLDGVILDQYRALPQGGTSLEDIAKMPRSIATLDFTMTGKAPRAGDILTKRGSGARVLGLPVGIRATDALIETMMHETGVACPQWLTDERGRLLDAYADGHKYVFGKRVGLYGEPELVVALAMFLAEIGAKPVLCATGARNHALSKALEQLLGGLVVEVLDDTDFGKIEKGCRRTEVELLIGSSKGYGIARRLGIPLIRTGFPIHDRIGAGRLLSVGYRGTLSFFDTLVNAFMEHQQNASDVGYSYL
jgi:nitrogenase molybdenum-iron protein NifN